MKKKQTGDQIYNEIKEKGLMYYYRHEIFKFVLVVSCSAGFCLGTAYLLKKFNIPEDGPVEELVEEIIKNQSGITIDLTPYSSER